MALFLKHFMIFLAILFGIDASYGAGCDDEDFAELNPPYKMLISSPYSDDYYGAMSVARKARSKEIAERRLRNLAPMDQELKSKIQNALNWSDENSLSPLQIRAVKTARSIGNFDAYTPSQLIRQERVLAAVGFSLSDIKALRKAGILGKWALKFNKPDSGKLIGMSLKVSSFTRSTLLKLQSGKKLNYIIDNSGNLHIAEDSILFSKDNLIVAKITKAGGDSEEVLVLEGGEISLKGDEVEFSPKYGADITPEEDELIVSDLMSRFQGLKFSKPGLRSAGALVDGKSTKRVFNCLDILKKGKEGNSFVMDKLIGENLLSASAILTTEAFGAGRFSSEKGRQVLAADVVGGNVIMALNALVGKTLVMKNAKLATSLVARTAAGLGSIQVHKQFYKHMVDEEPEETASKIANFDTAHFLLKLPMNHYTDKWLIKKLPEVLFNSCAKGGKMHVVFSPRMVRIYERYFSAVLYFGARKLIVDE